MGPTVDRMRSHHRATHTHTCSSHSDGTLETRLTWASLGCGRKPGDSEKSHTDVGRMCKLHTEWPAENGVFFLISVIMKWHRMKGRDVRTRRTGRQGCSLRPCSVFRCLCTRCLTFLLFRSRSAVAYFGFSFPGSAKSHSSLVHSPKTCWHCSSATVSFLFLFLNFIRRFIPFLFFYCRLSEVSHGRC